MQGQTIKKNSVLVLHWSVRMQTGMAYVMLGRSERLQDIFIVKDKFDISIIKTKLIDNANCQDMWVRDSSLHKGLPGPDGHPFGPGALS